MKNIKPGKLYDLKYQDDIDLMEIYTNDPRNLGFLIEDQNI